MASKRVSASKSSAWHRRARPIRQADLPLPDVAHVISLGEQAVMKVFYRYLMTPGHMLCFNSNDYDTHQESLHKLVQRGLLQAERFRGGFALTAKGYDAMRSSE